MLKNYLKRGCTNSFYFAVTSLCGKGMWLLAMPSILSMLTIQEIGLFDFYQSIFMIGSLMISSLTALPLSRFYLKHRNNQDLQQTTVGTSILFVLACSLVCVVAGLFAALRYTYCGDCYYIMLSLFNLSLFGCFVFVTFFAQIREKLREYMLLYCAQNLLALILLCVSLRWSYGVSAWFWANGLSYVLCLPFFVMLFKKAGSYTKDAAIEHLAYGTPLCIYNILYMLLFAVDRWYLAATFGYELVGLYAVLWYFGRMFTYASMALHDASPMLLYNAQHEQDGMQIIARSLRYVTIVYVSGALLLVPCSYLLLIHFLPTFAHLVTYLPLFVMSLLCVEVGRFWQAGFTLATKTVYIPIISCITLLVQIALLYALGLYGLFGVLYANLMSFSLYALLNAFGSAYVYSRALFDTFCLLALFALYVLYNMLLWACLYTLHPVWHMAMLGVTWPASLWFFGVIHADEKQFFIQTIKKSLRLA